MGPQSRRLTGLAALAFGAAAVVLAVTCARGRAVDVQHVTPDTPDSVFVEVINDNYYDARLYALYAGGARYPLGTVGGNLSQARVAIPWTPRPLVVELFLVIGGGHYVSDVLSPQPGEVVQVRLPPNLDASGFFRRVR